MPLSVHISSANTFISVQVNTSVAIVGTIVLLRVVRLYCGGERAGGGGGGGYLDVLAPPKHWLVLSELIGGSELALC